MNPRPTRQNEIVDVRSAAKRFIPVLIVGMLLSAGCGDTQPARSAMPPPSVVNAPPPPLPPVVAPKVPETVERKAEKGVDEKGRHYGVGFVVTPVASLFATRERMVFDMQIPQAMKLFQATEGRMPSSEEEFMEKIIKLNRIKLPELPEGHRYFYDPKKEQLMVRRPAG